MSLEITNAPARQPMSATPMAASEASRSARTPQEAPAKVATPKPVLLSVNPEAERQQVQEAVAMLNQQVSKTKAGLGFSMDEALGRPVVTVTNTVSGEVIRQIPNETVVRVAHYIEGAKGLLLNSRA